MSKPRAPSSTNIRLQSVSGGPIERERGCDSRRQYYGACHGHTPRAFTVTIHLSAAPSQHPPPFPPYTPRRTSTRLQIVGGPVHITRTRVYHLTQPNIRLLIMPRDVRFELLLNTSRKHSVN